MGIGMNKISNIKKRQPNGYTISKIYTYQYDIWQQKYKKLLDTAISSWSGFVYQGKVAIYHVLKEINNEDYTLQLDSLDDFAILNKSGAVVSLHQVKAKKSYNFSAYKKAFEQLEYGGDIIDCDSLYFHLARKITDKTVIEIEDEFYPIKVYMYNDDSYCNVNEIDTAIETLIIELMREYHSDDESKASSDYAIKARKYLDDLVVKKLLNIHRMIHDDLKSETISAYEERIEFLEFIDILKKDLNQENLGDDYYLYQIKSDICRYHQGYCLDEDNELSTNDLQRLNSIILKFEQLNKNEMLNFIKNIMPHKVLKFNISEDYKDNTPNKEGIEEVFLETIRSIKKPPNITDEKSLQWLSNNLLYSPTIINIKDNNKNQKKISKRIVTNALDNALNLLYESDKLITSDIEVEEIASPTLIGNIYDNNKNHIMQWKKVSLISIENAKGEIDD